MLYLFIALLSVGLGMLVSVCHHIARQQRAQIDALEGGKYFQVTANSAKGTQP